MRHAWLTSVLGLVCFLTAQQSPDEPLQQGSASSQASTLSHSRHGGARREALRQKLAQRARRGSGSNTGGDGPLSGLLAWLGPAFPPQQPSTRGETTPPHPCTPPVACRRIRDILQAGGYGARSTGAQAEAACVAVADAAKRGWDSELRVRKGCRLVVVGGGGGGGGGPSHGVAGVMLGVELVHQLGALRKLLSTVVGNLSYNVPVLRQGANGQQSKATLKAMSVGACVARTVLAVVARRMTQAVWHGCVFTGSTTMVPAAVLDHGSSLRRAWLSLSTSQQQELIASCAPAVPMPAARGKATASGGRGSRCTCASPACRAVVTIRGRVQAVAVRAGMVGAEAGDAPAGDTAGSGLSIDECVFRQQLVSVALPDVGCGATDTGDMSTCSHAGVLATHDGVRCWMAAVAQALVAQQADALAASLAKSPGPSGADTDAGAGGGQGGCGGSKKARRRSKKKKAKAKARGGTMIDGAGAAGIGSSADHHPVDSAAAEAMAAAAHRSYAVAEVASMAQALLWTVAEDAMRQAEHHRTVTARIERKRAKKRAKRMLALRQFMLSVVDDAVGAACDVAHVHRSYTKHRQSLGMPPVPMRQPSLAGWEALALHCVWQVAVALSQAGVPTSPPAGVARHHSPRLATGDVLRCIGWKAVDAAEGCAVAVARRVHHALGGDCGGTTAHRGVASVLVQDWMQGGWTACGGGGMYGRGQRSVAGRGSGGGGSGGGGDDGGGGAEGGGDVTNHTQPCSPWLLGSFAASMLLDACTDAAELSRACVEAACTVLREWLTATPVASPTPATRASSSRYEQQARTPPTRRVICGADVDCVAMFVALQTVARGEPVSARMLDVRAIVGQHTVPRVPDGTPSHATLPDPALVPPTLSMVTQFLWCTQFSETFATPNPWTMGLVRRSMAVVAHLKHRMTHHPPGSDPHDRLGDWSRRCSQLLHRMCGTLAISPTQLRDRASLRIARAALKSEGVRWEWSLSADEAARQKRKVPPRPTLSVTAPEFTRSQHRSRGGSTDSNASEAAAGAGVANTVGRDTGDSNAKAEPGMWGIGLHACMRDLDVYNVTLLPPSPHRTVVPSPAHSSSSSSPRARNRLDPNAQAPPALPPRPEASPSVPASGGADVLATVPPPVPQPSLPPPPLPPPRAHSTMYKLGRDIEEMAGQLEVGGTLQWLVCARAGCNVGRVCVCSRWLRWNAGLNSWHWCGT